MAAREENTDAGLRKASSLLVCRDGHDGLEVLVLKRTETMRFLPGFLSFPGGSLDAQDHLDASCWASHLLDGEQENDAEYAVGAVRETLEETGLLAAICDKHGKQQDGLIEPSWQTALLTGETTLEQVLEQLELRLDGRNLRFVGRWITPPFMPKRFDTRFFITTCSGQAANLRMNPGENEWAAWYRPIDILERIQDKVEKAAPPTKALLRAMAKFDTAASCFTRLSVPGPDPNDPALQSVLDDLNR